MPAPYDLTREELADLLEGEPAYRARQVWEGLHARVQRPEEMTELPPLLPLFPVPSDAVSPTANWRWRSGR